MDDWWLAPALLPRAKVLDVALQLEARDGAPGLGRLQFVELLGHVGLRAMPGDTPKRRLLELVAWLDKSKGRAALGHPHRATLALNTGRSLAATRLRAERMGSPLQLCGARLG